MVLQVTGAFLNSLSTGIGLKFITVGQAITEILQYVFAIAGFLLLLYLIYGGYQYLSSGGDPKAVAAAKQTLTYAIAGFIIVFISFWIVQFIGTALGLWSIISIFGS